MLYVKLHTKTYVNIRTYIFLTQKTHGNNEKTRKSVQKTMHSKIYLY